MSSNSSAIEDSDYTLVARARTALNSLRESLTDAARYFLTTFYMRREQKLVQLYRNSVVRGMESLDSFTDTPGWQFFSSQLEEGHRNDTAQQLLNRSIQLMGQAVIFLTVLGTAMIAVGLPVIPRAISLMREALSQLQRSNGTTQRTRRQTANGLVQGSPREADEASRIHATLVQAVERAYYSLGPSPESPGDAGRSLLTLTEDFVQLLESLADGLRHSVTASGTEALQARVD